MPGSRAPGRRRLRRVAGLVDRAAEPVRYVRGTPREDGPGLVRLKKNELAVLNLTEERSEVCSEYLKVDRLAKVHVEARRHYIAKILFSD